MLEILLSVSLALVSPQGPNVVGADAVAVRGDTELSPAEAFASARRRAEDHVREQWAERAAHALDLRRPFWLPQVLADRAVQTWLADLPVDECLRLVDREDRERTHEFGNSYQTTLWVAEEPRSVKQGERELRQRLRDLERATAVKFGGIAAAWTLLVAAIAWLDRLSRGYMTGTLRLLGLLVGGALPVFLFLG
ncbi:MAG: hypothetical protein JNM25_10320 [Planctomycetes bacterium]|nr:hypothetical protein [Planctomycetota bacterium]